MSTQPSEDQFGGVEVVVGTRGGTGSRGVALDDTWSLIDGGTKVQFQLEDGTKLPPMPLPVGPKGDAGNAHIRRGGGDAVSVYIWDARQAAEALLYGDTGVRRLTDGSLVHRTGNIVMTNIADLAALPEGFQPAIPQPAGTKMFTTVQAWPLALPGTKETSPAPIDGLFGFSAAQQAGYTGTSQQWNESVYRSGIPEGGAAGDVLYRRAVGAEWGALPLIGGAAWSALAPAAGWEHIPGRRAEVRVNNGSLEFRGGLRYISMTRYEVGMWSTEELRVATLPAGHFPSDPLDVPTTVYRGDAGLRPGMARVIVNKTGQMSLLAFSNDGAADTFPVGKDPIGGDYGTSLNISHLHGTL